MKNLILVECNHLAHYNVSSWGRQVFLFLSVANVFCNLLLRFYLQNIMNMDSALRLIIPPANYVCWGRILFSCCLSVFPSVCLSVTFWFFFNILKRQWWKFIKFCRHIDIDKMYIYNRKLRAMGQFYCSYCPL